MCFSTNTRVSLEITNKKSHMEGFIIVDNDQPFLIIFFFALFSVSKKIILLNHDLSIKVGELYSRGDKTEIRSRDAEEPSEQAFLLFA